MDKTRSIKASFSVKGCTTGRWSGHKPNMEEVARPMIKISPDKAAPATVDPRLTSNFAKVEARVIAFFTDRYFPKRRTPDA